MSCSKFETASFRSRLAVLIMLLWRFFAVFIVTRAESYRFLDYLWLLGRRTARPPPATERTIRPMERWNRQENTYFRRFSAVSCRYSYLSRRYSGVRCSRKLGCMKTLLILKQTFLRRISDVTYAFLSTVHGQKKIEFAAVWHRLTWIFRRRQTESLNGSMGQGLKHYDHITINFLHNAMIQNAWLIQQVRVHKCKYRQLRARRALLLYKVYGNSALLSLNWRYYF